MTRTIDADLANQLAAPVLYPFLAVFIDLPDPVIVWNGIGTLIAAGREWEGVGGIGSLSPAGETGDGASVGMTATLSGIPEKYRDDIAGQARRGAGFEVWVGALNPDFKTVAAGPVKVWAGKVDGYEITDTGTEITVTIRGEGGNRDQGRPRIRRYSDAEQQQRFPGDLFFEFLPQMAEVKILWAKGDISGTNVASVTPWGSIRGG